MGDICDPLQEEDANVDHSDKRRYRRLPVLVDCRIEGASGRGETRLTDLTPVGCYVDSNLALTEGTKITLVVALGENEVTLSGRVVPMKAAGFGFGVEFVDLDASTQQQLEAYYQQKETTT